MEGKFNEDEFAHWFSRLGIHIKTKAAVSLFLETAVSG